MTTQKWKIPDDMVPFIKEKCPNGKYITCNVCCIYDYQQLGFRKVCMRNRYWRSYFRDHLHSARHKDNCQRKANHEAANRRQISKWEPPQKKMKQSVLSFATREPTCTQVCKRIVGGICPTLASGDNSNKNIDLTAEVIENNNL